MEEKKSFSLKDLMSSQELKQVRQRHKEKEQINNASNNDTDKKEDSEEDNEKDKKDKTPTKKKAGEGLRRSSVDKYLGAASKIYEGKLPNASPAPTEKRRAFLEKISHSLDADEALAIGKSRERTKEKEKGKEREKEREKRQKDSDDSDEDSDDSDEESWLEDEDTEAEEMGWIFPEKKDPSQIPALKILILIVGSRGDVQPFISLAQGLIKCVSTPINTTNHNQPQHNTPHHNKPQHGNTSATRHKTITNRNTPQHNTLQRF